jgi:Carbohydrate family 9 binding domain-like
MIRGIVLIALTICLGPCKPPAPEQYKVRYTTADSLWQLHWDSVPAQAIDHAILKADLREGPADISASFKMQYNDRFLFVEISVVDEIKSAVPVLDSPADAAAWSPWDNDAVELAFNNDPAGSLLFGYRLLRVSRGKKLPEGLQFFFTDLPGGYRLAAAIPLSYTGAVQKKFPCCIRVLDNDTPPEPGIYGGRETTLCWATTGKELMGEQRESYIFGEAIFLPE